MIDIFVNIFLPSEAGLRALLTHTLCGSGRCVDLKADYFKGENMGCLTVRHMFSSSEDIWYILKAATIKE